MIELQVHALNILANLVTLVPHQIYELGGHLTLTKFLDAYEDKPRRKACLLALQALSKFEIFKPDLPNLFDILMPVVNNQKAEGTLN